MADLPMIQLSCSAIRLGIWQLVQLLNLFYLKPITQILMTSEIDYPIVCSLQKCIISYLTIPFHCTLLWNTNINDIQGLIEMSRETWSS